MVLAVWNVTSFATTHRAGQINTTFMVVLYQSAFLRIDAEENHAWENPKIYLESGKEMRGQERCRVPSSPPHILSYARFPDESSFRDEILPIMEAGSPARGTDFGGVCALPVERVCLG